MIQEFLDFVYRKFQEPKNDYLLGMVAPTVARWKIGRKKRREMNLNNQFQKKFFKVKSSNSRRLRGRYIVGNARGSAEVSDRANNKELGIFRQKKNGEGGICLPVIFLTENACSPASRFLPFAAYYSGSNKNIAPAFKSLRGIKQFMPFQPITFFLTISPSNKAATTERVL
ncbi:MAG: hypothetical protein IKN49_04750 [Elusimicrobiaceae bacterium]|nr:hypothetical protein [Elusimicrobiaceae bacterium]